MAASPVKTPHSMLSPRLKRPSRHSDASRDGIRFVNDDDAEKRQRKLEKALQLTTPRHHERRKSGGLTSGLTQKEMSDHYSNCIKLSSENKINAKNAFGLHLIDVMQKMLKDKSSVIDMTNFQVASCTLDASAKIYAGRVDSVHAEAFKILGGLGSGRQREDSEEQDGQAKQPAAKPTRKVMPSSTVEQNVKNLNTNNFELEFEVDPLFRKAAAELDEGGTESMLMHTLPIRDVTCELLLDSNIRLDDLQLDCNELTSSVSADALEIAEWSSRIDWHSLHICPSISNFEFVQTSSTQNNNPVIPMAIDPDRTVMAPPAVSDYSYLVPNNVDEFAHDDVDCYGPDDDFGASQEEVGDNVHAHEHTVMGRVGDTDVAKRASLNGSNELVLASAPSRVGALLLTDALQPTEYSYFNMDKVSMWAGPTHWKIKPPTKQIDENKKSMTEKKKGRQRKKVFSVDFTTDVDFTKAFRKTKASTTLSKAQLAKQEGESNLLPDDCHYEIDNLFKTFLRVNVVVRRQSTQTHKLRDEQVSDDWYDYNNPNDSVNYCPDIEVDGFDRDDSDNGFSQDHTVIAAGGNLSSNIHSHSHLSNDQSSNPSLTTAIGEQTCWLQENMVAMPQKVQKININFSNKTRKMDIKRLKSSMWSLIEGDTMTQEKENQPANRDDRGNDVSEPKRHCTSLSEIYKQLPGQISTSMADNLTVHISLICLLHLANEQGLHLKGSEKMNDVTVVQTMTAEE